MFKILRKHYASRGKPLPTLIKEKSPFRYWVPYSSLNEEKMRKKGQCGSGLSRTHTHTYAHTHTHTHTRTHTPAARARLATVRAAVLEGLRGDAPWESTHHWAHLAEGAELPLCYMNNVRCVLSIWLASCCELASVLRVLHLHLKSSRNTPCLSTFNLSLCSVLAKNGFVLHLTSARNTPRSSTLNSSLSLLKARLAVLSDCDTVCHSNVSS